MGIKDNETKCFIEKNRIFADIFNYYIYNGKQTIEPDSLQTLDTAEIVLTSKINIEKKSIKKYRDVIKQLSIKCDNKVTYALLAVENQSDIHYAMPVRNMLYDALRYTNQIEDLAKDNVKNKRLRSSEEYLSGLTKNDRIFPVITLVINFSGKKWEAPTSLRQMFVELDKNFLKYIRDYRINLIDPATISKKNFDKFLTELREVLLCVKYSRNKNKFYEVVRNDKRFEHVPNEAVSLINTLTGSNLKIDENKEESNMCIAIEEIKEDGRKEGIKEGIKEGKIEGKFEAFLELIKDGIITIKQAAEKLNMSVASFKRQSAKYGYEL